MATPTRPGYEERQRQPHRRRSVPKGAAAAASRLHALTEGGSSVPEVMAALRQAGVKDLEDLLKRLLANTEAEAEAVDVFASVPEPPPDRSFSHRPPRIPFTVSGVTYDPVDIKRFDGQPLHFVCRQFGHATELIGLVGDEWVRALTTYAQLVRLSQLAAPAAGLGPTSAYHVPAYPVLVGTYTDPRRPFNRETASAGAVTAGLAPPQDVPSLICRLYQHANFRGVGLIIRPGTAYADFTKIGLLGGGGTWNDIVSSVKSDGATVLLFEAINYVGSTLLVMPYDLLTNLETVGWNDRVSSVKNFGKIY
jgi:hypothetical protein